MPNSQIDMVVRDDDGVRWNVCGDFQVPTEQLDPKIYVCVVVRQGDVIARGDDVVSSRSWRFEVKPEGGASSKPGGPRSCQRWPSPRRTHWAWRPSPGPSGSTS
jgi:hypothetical protein